MRNLILTGFMGTGKTVVGKRLAKRLGWRFVDVDKLIETAAGITIPEIFEKKGEAAFRRLESRQISKVVRDKGQVIATGGGAFTDPENRRRLLGNGMVVCLMARPQVILSRVGRRIHARPMLKGSVNTLSAIRALLAKRARDYQQADLTVDTSDSEIEEVVERLWQALSSCVCNSWQYLLDNAKQLAARYAGRYVAVIGKKIVASGRTQLEAYQKIPRKRAGSAEAGVYYISLPEESLIAL